MSSLLTNTSAMSAVQNLTMTQRSLQTVQSQISTGLRVGTAKDNAAYWSIATSMKTTNIAYSSISDSLNLGSSVLGTATSALGNVVSIMQKMVADLTTAQGANATTMTQIGTDIKSLQSQLSSTINAASFNGVNLLNQSSTTTTQNYIATAVSGAGSTFSINTLTINYANNALTTQGAGGSTGILDATGTYYTGGSVMTFVVGAATTTGDISNILKDVNVALGSVQTVAATLGAYENNVSEQSAFIKQLTDSLTAGIGSLEDADMNQASTRLNALQTQQQLGIQALSIANQNSQMILKLFNG